MQADPGDATGRHAIRFTSGMSTARRHEDSFVGLAPTYMSPRPIKRSLLAKYCADDSRIGSYPSVRHWNGKVTPHEYCDSLSNIDGELALFMHLPFCALRCGYCGCTAAVAKRGDEVGQYITRLDAELELLHSVMGRKPVLRELHWGGGTPNFLADGQLVRVFDLVAARFSLAADIDCSLEADPRLVTTTQLRWLRGLGFARISFGVQDLDPRVQHAIGRVQSIALITDVVERAREQGFRSLGLDVLYGLPYQSVESFADTVDAVVELAPERIACRGYVHTPWLRPHQRRIEEEALPERRVRFALYQLAVQRFTDAGYVWIGEDQFAKPHDSLAVAAAAGQLHRDHMGYTARHSRAFLGAGVSAISEVGDIIAQNELQLDDWQRAIDDRRLPFARGHRLSEDDRTRRRAIRALTTNLSVRRDAFPEDNDRTLDAFREFESDGLVMINDHSVNVTPTGRYFLSHLVGALNATDSLSGAGTSARRSHVVS